MKASDRFGLATGYIASLLGLALVGCGVPLFWGSWRQILAGLLAVLAGCVAYLVGRWHVWWVRREMREDADRTAAC